MNNPLQTVITQYASSPRLTQLLSDWSTDLEPNANLNLFYSGIWNVSTAAGYGLDLWGRVVGVDRNLQADIAPAGYFGFSQTPFSALGFANTGASGRFYTGEALTEAVTLDDSAFRTLILVKAFENYSNASAYSVNTILATVFGASGACYAQEDAPMHFNLVFKFALSPTDIAILTETGILLRPCGVSYSIVEEP